MSFRKPSAFSLSNKQQVISARQRTFGEGWRFTSCYVISKPLEHVLLPLTQVHNFCVSLISLLKSSLLTPSNSCVISLGTFLSCSSCYFINKIQAIYIIPFGVLINQDRETRNCLEAFCRETHFQIKITVEKNSSLWHSNKALRKKKLCFPN